SSYDTPALLNRLKKPSLSDFAFTSKYSLLASDQGVRGILHVFNDIFFVASKDLALESWQFGSFFEDEDITNENIGEAILSIPRPIGKMMMTIAEAIIEFEWQNSSAPDLSREASLKKM